MNAMQRDYFWPSKLTDREQPRTWEEQGATDMWQRANKQARETLDTYHPDYLDIEVDQKIRDRFKIRLPRYSLPAIKHKALKQ